MHSRAAPGELGRDRYLETVLSVQQHLLAHGLDPARLVEGVLAPLGRVAGASRVAWFQCHRSGDGWIATRQAEWCGPAIAPRLGHPADRAIDVNAIFPRWLTALRRAEPIARAVRALPEGPERRYLENLGLRATLDFPILAAGAFVGVLGFSDIDHDEPWSEDVTNLLSVAANAIAIACERERAEARHKEGEARFLRITSALRDVVWEWNPEEGLIWFGPHPTRLLGNEVDPSRTDRWWEELIHPDDRPRVLASVNRAIGAGDERWSEEYRATKPGGGWIVVQTRARIERFEGRLRLVGVVTDVTDKRRLERQLALVDRQATLGSLAGGLAHEINNPLASLLSNIDFVRDLPGLPAAALEALAEAREGGNRVGAIVDRLRSFAQPEGSDLVPVSLERLVSHAHSLLPASLRMQMELRLSLPPELPRVVGGESRLVQILVDLFRNAIDARRDQRPVQVEVAAREEGDRVLIEVHDDGKGIDPSLLTRVFDPFFTTRRDEGRVGLGLAIVASLLRSVGGSIAIESELGKGTSAVLSLPATR